MADDLVTALLAAGRRPKFHELLAQGAASAAPTPSWGAALARALQGGMAGLLERGEGNSNVAEFDRQNAPMASAPQASAPQSAPPTTLVGNNPTYAPEGQPSPPVQQAGNMPRGYRNNNPLNIEAGNFTQGQPGFNGSDGRFAKFASMDQGAAAASKLLDVYQNKHGLNTVNGILNRWAPPSDGNNVSAYAANVSKQLGIDPNTPVPPEMRQQLIAAMAQHENGRPMPRSSAAPQQSVAMALQQPDDGAALPPGAQPAQGQSPFGPQPPQAKPPQMAQASPQTGRVAPQIPPEVMARAREAARRDGPAAGEAVLAPYRKTADQWELVPSPVPGDKNQYQRNTVSNELKPLNPQPFAVNVNSQTEAEFDKEAAKHQAKRYDELAGEAPAAKQLQSDVSMLRDLGEKIKTGKIAEVKAVIGPYADALGIKVDNLSEIQAFEAVVNRIAPSLRVKGSGAQSDFELRNFIKQMPTIGNTPEGNAIIDKTMQGFVQNKIAAAEIGSMALNKEISRKDADKRLRELPDPMAEWREFNKKTKAATDAAAPQVIDGYKIRVK